MNQLAKKLWHRIKTKGVDIELPFLRLVFSALISMRKFLDEMWYYIKIRGERLGIRFLIAGLVVLIVSVSLRSANESTKTTLLALGLSLMSVGLGFISVGISANADRRQTALLQRLDRNVAQLPSLIKGDILTPSGQIVAKKMLEEQSKEIAQSRLDEDTRRVGYVRGELFQNEDGSWSIAWGGKHPL